jgi:hypothetical protein
MTQLTQCANCGRYGWHPTERCPGPRNDKPTALVLGEQRLALCTCGWSAEPRWLIAGAKIDAQMHAYASGHELASPLVRDV